MYLRHSRPSMTRNPNQPYSPPPLLGCLGGCSTLTHTWHGLVLVCALFVIMYLCCPRWPFVASTVSELADASAAVSPSPLFLVASTPQPYGTPAHQDRAPPPLPVCSSPSLLAPSCVRACLPPSRHRRPCLGGFGWGLRVGLVFLVMAGGAIRWTRRRAPGVGVAP